MRPVPLTDAEIEEIRRRNIAHDVQALLADRERLLTRIRHLEAVVNAARSFYGYEWESERGRQERLLAVGQALDALEQSQKKDSAT